MKSDFEVRLMQAEQNAARALAEIDDAWQRDKLEWGPQAQSQWPIQRQELEKKVVELEAKVSCSWKPSAPSKKSSRLSRPRSRRRKPCTCWKTAD